MKVVKVMVHVEDACERCGGPYRRMGLTDFCQTTNTINPEGEPCGDPDICPGCRERERIEAAKQERQRRAQARWIKKAKAKTGTAT
jgi:hypothetical protein